MTQINAMKTQKSLKKYPDVLSVSQVQQILAVGERAVYKLIHDGDLVSLKVGKGYRIPKASVEVLLKGGAA